MTPYLILSKKVKFENMVNGKYSGLLLFNYIRNKYGLKLYFVSNFRVALRALVSPSSKILKIKETITMHINSNKANVHIFCCSLAPNRIQKCGKFKLWFAEDDAELLQNTCRTCSTLIFPCSTNKILNS